MIDEQDQDAKALEASKLAKRAVASIEKFLTQGNDANKIAPVSSEEARKIAAGCMLSLMADGLSVKQNLFARIAIDLRIGPETTVKVEFNGPLSLEELNRLQRHLTLLGETLPAE